MFLYFIPNHPRGSVTRADMLAAGLGHALRGENDPTSTSLRAGPGGTEGMLVTSNDDDVTSYNPSTQTWAKGPDGRYWAGVINSRKPGPVSLMRKTVHAGNVVRLRDGNDWIIPHAIAPVPDSRPSIPMLYGLGDDGKTITWQIAPEFRKLFEDAETVWEWMGDRKTMSIEEQMVIAIRALSVNYSVGVVEAIGLLRLLGESELVSVLRAITDADAYENWLECEEKKKRAITPGASPTNSGVTGSTPTAPTSP
jgi:hypothetical protein